MLSGWDNLTRDEQARMADGIVSGQARGGPWHLELQPTNHCNVNCLFCINELVQKNLDDNALRWDVLRPFLEAASRNGLRLVRLSGGGEPFLYPSIQPLLDLCGERGIRLVEVTTNGTMIKAHARQMVEIGTDRLCVSLNEHTPARYATTMRSSEKMFHRALEGIEAFRAAREAIPCEKRPILRLQFFLWKESWRELAEIYRFGRSLGAEEIFIRSFFAFPDESRIAPEHYPAIRDLLRDIIAEDSRPGEHRLLFDLSQESWELNLFTINEQSRHDPKGCFCAHDYVERQPRREYCYMPWYTAVIMASGKVYPCDPLMKESLGNIYEQSMEEIWRGEPFERLRAELRQVMLLRGRLTYSHRLHRHIKPICINNFGCQWTYNLCSANFYRRVMVGFERGTSRLERLEAQTRDAGVRVSQAVLRRLRGKKS